jgi:hypothetical protein
MGCGVERSVATRRRGKIIKIRSGETGTGDLTGHIIANGKPRSVCRAEAGTDVVIAIAVCLCTVLL